MDFVGFSMDPIEILLGFIRDSIGIVYGFYGTLQGFNLDSIGVL